MHLPLQHPHSIKLQFFAEENPCTGYFLPVLINESLERDTKGENCSDTLKNIFDADLNSCWREPRVHMSVMNSLWNLETEVSHYFLPTALEN